MSEVPLYTLIPHPLTGAAREDDELEGDGADLLSWMPELTRSFQSTILKRIYLRGSSESMLDAS